MRESLAVVLAILAALFLAAGIVGIYVNDALFESEEFADRATVALQDEDVQDALAKEIADVFIEQDPELIPDRPLIEAAAIAIMDTGSFQAIFREAAAEAHTVFFDGDESVVLELGDAGLLLFNVIRANNPEFAAILPKELPAGLVVLSKGEFTAETAAVAEDVRLFAFIVPILAVLLLVGALLVTANPRRIFVIVGLSLALLSGVLIAALSIARGLITDSFINDAVARVVWDAYLGDLTPWLLVVMGVSVLVAAVAASLLRPVDVPALMRSTWATAFVTPRSQGVRIVRAVVLAVAALLVIVDPIGALTLIASVAGVLTLFYAVTEVMRVIDERASAAEVAGAKGAFSGVLRGAIAVVVAAVVLGLGVWLIDDDGQADAAQAIDVCNGHAELCDRPITEVALGASHNSMSAARDGHAFAMHDGGMIEQLKGGLRAFQIDTWYGIPVDEELDLVLTELPAGSREEQIEDFGEPAVRAAERLRAKSSASGERNTYLCHGYCEYGATPFAGELENVRKWLEANPNEVIVLVIQDAISPEDTEKAFVESGLIDLVYHHDGSDVFPTLREMIASGERVIVTAENDAGTGRDWYLQAFDFMEETPFRAESPETLSCAPARGGTGKPFFQLNNWIQKPLPTTADAAVVNSEDFIVDRVERCEQAGRPRPGVVAVNFWGVGELMEAVNELNGVSGSPPAE